MAHNRYAPPTAKLTEQAGPHILIPGLVALIGGVVCWFTALKVMKWVYVQFWLPRIEAGHSLPAALENVITVSIVYSVFGAALALLRARPWWAPWSAFMIGTAIHIVIRNLLGSRELTTLGDVFLGPFFLAGAVASLASLFIASRFLESRSNTSLERTREE